MKTSDIRARFIDYFAARGHDIVPSYSLVPGNDPTLLFTNSGMVQFKDVFLGEDKRANPRAVTAQRCVRAGGKHNDLENVGYTARHHTFFEMLGNFSFGDYFKAQAIAFAWELLTVEFGLPREKLWVTVFEDDGEAENIWLNDLGVDASRFSRIGAADNFWSMGDTGPCGPCSEIFYDHGPTVAGGPPGSADAEGDRFVEIWNLVFMQFNRAADGALTPLPKPSVDTGMGLERMAAVLQGVHSNYDIDLFRNLTRAAADAVQVDGDAAAAKQSLQVIADHIRSAAFLITDGVLPANEGRGYVLRRIIRRAIRHGYQLGQRDAFMHKLVQPLVDEMGEACPELATAAARVEQALQRENEKFAETLEHGIKILEREIAGLSGGHIKGQVAFKLYDTYGFPLDLTADIAREHNLTVDQDGFDAAMAEQRTRARAASRFGGDGDGDGDGDTKAALAGIGKTEFTGYDELQTSVTVRALLDASRRAVDELRAGDAGAVVTDATPFYAQGGGQIGDRGALEFADATFAVEDTRAVAGAIAHFGRVTAGRLRAGDRGCAKVDAESRRGCMAHHSATHLLHAALKAELGAHVQQKGSLVEAQRLRFDFSHPAPVEAAQLVAVEQQVNRAIRANSTVAAVVMDLDAAKAGGAEALFGEKYDARVRTIRMGESFELCGGTHVAHSGDIGAFKITAEAGVAAGVRRIEAVCGAPAEAWVAARLALLDAAAATVKSTPRELRARLQALLDERRELHQRVEALQAKLAAGGGGGLAPVIRDIGAGDGGTVKLATLRIDDADAKTMRLSVDQWKSKLGRGIVFAAGARGGKVALVAGVTADLAGRYHAGKLLAVAAAVVDGRGGGKPEFAQGGGTRVAAIDDAAAAFCRAVAAVGDGDGDGDGDAGDGDGHGDRDGGGHGDRDGEGHGDRDGDGHGDRDGEGHGDRDGDGAGANAGAAAKSKP